MLIQQKNLEHDVLTLSIEIDGKSGDYGGGAELVGHRQGVTGSVDYVIARIARDGVVSLSEQGIKTLGLTIKHETPTVKTTGTSPLKTRDTYIEEYRRFNAPSYTLDRN